MKLFHESRFLFFRGGADAMHAAEPADTPNRKQNTAENTEITNAEKMSQCIEAGKKCQEEIAYIMQFTKKSAEWEKYQNTLNTDMQTLEKFRTQIEANPKVLTSWHKRMKSYERQVHKVFLQHAEIADTAMDAAKKQGSHIIEMSAYIAENASTPQRQQDWENFGANMQKIVDELDGADSTDKAKAERIASLVQYVSTSEAKIIIMKQEVEARVAAKKQPHVSVEQSQEHIEQSEMSFTQMIDDFTKNMSATELQAYLNQFHLDAKDPEKKRVRIQYFEKWFKNLQRAATALAKDVYDKTKDVRQAKAAMYQYLASKQFDVDGKSDFVEADAYTPKWMAMKMKQVDPTLPETSYSSAPKQVFNGIETDIAKQTVHLQAGEYIEIHVKDVLGDPSASDNRQVVGFKLHDMFLRGQQRSHVQTRPVQGAALRGERYFIIERGVAVAEVLRVTCVTGETDIRVSKTGETVLVHEQTS